MKSGEIIVVTSIITGVIAFLFGLEIGSHPSSRPNEGDSPIIERQPEAASNSRLDEIRSHHCAEEAVEVNFVSWMEFYWPDKKMSSDLTVLEVGDCEYNIRFEIKYGKEQPGFIGFAGPTIYIYQMTYSDDFEQFNLKPIRGVLF